MGPLVCPGNFYQRYKGYDIPLLRVGTGENGPLYIWEETYALRRQYECLDCQWFDVNVPHQQGQVTDFFYTFMLKMGMVHSSWCMTVLPDYWLWTSQSYLDPNKGNMTLEDTWVIDGQYLLLSVHTPLTEDVWPLWTNQFSVNRVQAAFGELGDNYDSKSTKQKIWTVCGSDNMEGEGGWTKQPLYLDDAVSFQNVKLSIAQAQSNQFYDIDVTFNLDKYPVCEICDLEIQWSDYTDLAGIIQLIINGKSKTCEQIGKTTKCYDIGWAHADSYFVAKFKSMLIYTGNSIFVTRTQQLIISIDIYGNWNQSASVYHCDLRPGGDCDTVTPDKVSVQLSYNYDQNANVQSVSFIPNNILTSRQFRIVPFSDVEIQFSLANDMLYKLNNYIEIDFPFEANSNFNQKLCFADFSISNCILSGGKFKLTAEGDVKSGTHWIKLYRAAQISQTVASSLITMQTTYNGSKIINWKNPNQQFTIEFSDAPREAAQMSVSIYPLNQGEYAFYKFQLADTGITLEQGYLIYIYFDYNYFDPYISEVWELYEGVYQLPCDFIVDGVEQYGVICTANNYRIVVNFTEQIIVKSTVTIQIGEVMNPSAKELTFQLLLMNDTQCLVYSTGYIELLETVPPLIDITDVKVSSDVLGFSSDYDIYFQIKSDTNQGGKLTTQNLDINTDTNIFATLPREFIINSISDPSDLRFSMSLTERDLQLTKSTLLTPDQAQVVSNYSLNIRGNALEYDFLNQFQMTTFTSDKWNVYDLKIQKIPNPTQILNVEQSYWTTYDQYTTKLTVSFYDEYGRVQSSNDAYSARSYGVLNNAFVGLKKNTYSLYVKDAKDSEITESSPIYASEGLLSDEYYVATKNKNEPINIDYVTLKPTVNFLEFSKDVRTSTMKKGTYKTSFRILGSSVAGVKYINWGSLEQSSSVYANLQKTKVIILSQSQGGTQGLVSTVTSQTVFEGKSSLNISVTCNPPPASSLEISLSVDDPTIEITMPSKLKFDKWQNTTLFNFTVVQINETNSNKFNILLSTTHRSYKISTPSISVKVDTYASSLEPLILAVYEYKWKTGPYSLQDVNILTNAAGTIYWVAVPVNNNNITITQAQNVVDLYSKVNNQKVFTPTSTNWDDQQLEKQKWHVSNEYRAGTNQSYDTSFWIQVQNLYPQVNYNLYIALQDMGSKLSKSLYVTKFKTSDMPKSAALGLSVQGSKAPDEKDLDDLSYATSQALFYPKEQIYKSKNNVWERKKKLRRLQEDSYWDIVFILLPGSDASKTPEEAISYYQVCTSCQATLQAGVSQTSYSYVGASQNKTYESTLMTQTYNVNITEIQTTNAGMVGITCEVDYNGVTVYLVIFQDTSGTLDDDVNKLGELTSQDVVLGLSPYSKEADIHNSSVADTSLVQFSYYGLDITKQYMACAATVSPWTSSYQGTYSDYPSCRVITFYSNEDIDEDNEESAYLQGISILLLVLGYFLI